MAVTKSCCCFKEVKNACKATAIFTIVTAIVRIIWLLSSLLSTKIAFWSEGSVRHVSIVVLVFDGVLLICGLLLLTGTAKGYRGRNIILTFIILMAVYLIINIGLGIYSHYAIINIHGSAAWKSVAIVISLIIWILPNILFVLGEMAAISFFQQLQEKHPEYGSPYSSKHPLPDSHPGPHSNGSFSHDQVNIELQPISLRPSQKEFRLPRIPYTFGSRLSFGGDYSNSYSDPGFHSVRPASYSDRPSHLPRVSSLYGGLYDRASTLHYSGLYGGNHFRSSSLANEYF